VLFNINHFAEEFCVCISVVLETSEGKILHGRNLDFHTFVKEISDLVFEVDYYLNDEHLYTELKILGIVGSFSGFRPGKFVVNAI